MTPSVSANGIETVETVLPPIEPEPTETQTHQPSPLRAPTARPTTTIAAIPPGTNMNLKQRQQLFEEVWQTINEHYLYEDFHGVDWPAIRGEFAPLVTKTATNEELYILLARMVSRLNDQHSRFLSPGAAVQEQTLRSGRETSVGVGIITTPTENGMMIQQVFPDSPAALSGLRPRDRIVAIDGIPSAGSSDIHGPEGSQVRLTVMRPGDQIRDVVLVRRPVETHISPVARRLDGDIGYLSINTLWINDMGEQVSGMLTDMVLDQPLHGLILDLRGNQGGWRDVLTVVLSHFVQGEVGEFFDRHKRMPLLINDSSGPDLRGLPLAVLVDEDTASYAELLAAILQLEANAHIVGMPSSGNTETIYAYELSNGARLWVAQEGFRLRNGVNLEGTGVQPNLVINVDWQQYSEQDDPHIQAAWHWLHQQVTSYKEQAWITNR